MFDLSGKTALITGGTGGIGSAIAHGLLAASCQVFAADLPMANRRPSWMVA
jgi:NAD(P)-dependent dehydrogenase (short-subunit alcohol dehydrogenase family)